MYLRRGQASVIGEAIEVWCAGDRLQSSDHEDRNSYTADFAYLTRGFAEYDPAIGLEPGNPFAAKAVSHADRWKFWHQEYEQNDNPYFAARLIFHSLMNLSGSQKTFLATSAEDAEDFARKLQKEGLSVFTNSIVVSTITDHRLENTPYEDRREALPGVLHNTHCNTLSLTEKILSRGRMRPESIARARAIQSSWLEATVKIIDVIAEESGGLEHVPVLEPKSITDQPLKPPLIYPFSG